MKTNGRDSREGKNSTRAVRAAWQSFWRDKRRRRKAFWSSVVASALATVLATVLTGAGTAGLRLVERWATHLLQIGPVAGPGSSPTQPTVSPTQPTESPTQPTESPTQPTVSPTQLPAKNSTLSCLKMVSEYPLDSWEVRAWIFPRRFVPNPAQIASLNEGKPDAVNRDLYDYGGFALFTYTQLIVENMCSHTVSIPD